MITMAVISTSVPGPAAYPLHVDADPPPQLSRWLWLVKWVLVVPHVVVLAFLWIAFVALSLAAFVAILVTGRYPQGIFAFNVGVLRWTWRVSYYSYGALATDQYPPFTLAEEPGYPAHLDVDRPEHLSRGLVLVKWWLLALPHYLVVALFVGTGAQTARYVSDRVVMETWPAQTGLIGLLVLVAGVVLLVRGSYPRGVYDLVLGLQRWVLRVAAYAALMTDVYPPFRLDTGGHDPGHAFAVPAPTGGGPAGTAPAAPASSPGGATARPPYPAGGPGAPAGPLGPAGAAPPRPRMVSPTAVGFGVVLLVLGTGSLAAGVSLGVGLAARDGAYVTGPAWRVSTPGYAVQTGQVTLDAPAPALDRLEGFLGDVRVRAEARDGEAVFLGVARAEDAARYLDGVQHTVTGPEDPVRQVPGGAPATPPDAADVWVAQAAGTGSQEVRLPVEDGDWVAVVMPTDGAPGLQARMDVGATLPWLVPAAIAATALGVLLVAGGAVLVDRGGRLRSPRPDDRGPAA